MILIRNCPHNNGIHTFYNKEKGTLIKTSTTSYGVASLQREYNGYIWYTDLLSLYDNSCITFYTHSSLLYSKLERKYISGKIGDPTKSLSENNALLLQAINIYLERWPFEKKLFVPMHGDFSLGNIIFTEGNATIIDWEHFSYNIAPWGFDLVNLLYESLFFTLKRRTHLKSKDLNMFLEIRGVIIKHLNRSHLFSCSISDLIRFYFNNAELWGPSIKKFPVLQFSKRQIEFIKYLESQQGS